MCIAGTCCSTPTKSSSHSCSCMSSSLTAALIQLPAEAVPSTHGGRRDCGKSSKLINGHQRGRSGVRNSTSSKSTRTTRSAFCGRSASSRRCRRRRCRCRRGSCRERSSSAGRPAAQWLPTTLPFHVARRSEQRRLLSCYRASSGFYRRKSLDESSRSKAAQKAIPNSEGGDFGQARHGMQITVRSIA